MVGCVGPMAWSYLAKALLGPDEWHMVVAMGHEEGRTEGHGGTPGPEGPNHFPNYHSLSLGPHHTSHPGPGL